MTYETKLMSVRGKKLWNLLPEHAMNSSDLVKTIGRPKIKRTREKDVITKRVGEWTHSRKRTKITYSRCGSSTHNARTYKFGEEVVQPLYQHKKKNTISCLHLDCYNNSMSHLVLLEILKVIQISDLKLYLNISKIKNENESTKAI